MKLTVSVAVANSAGDNTVVAELDRDGPLTAASLGLTIAEAKELLRGVQRQLVQAQLALHVEKERECRSCGARRWIKDRRPVCFKSLFGRVDATATRVRACGCGAASGTATTLTPDELTRWVAPELEYVQSWLATKVPYAPASELLTRLLPVDAGSSTSTVRRRTLTVGQRLDAELQETSGAAVSGRREPSDGPVDIGLDSGHVRSCRPHLERTFEIVVGRAIGRDGTSRSLGLVRRLETNQQIRYRIRHRLADDRANASQVTVFSDGDADLRRLQLAVLPNAEHVLDWYHLTRKLTVLKNAVSGKDAVAQLPAHHQHRFYLGVKSLKWRLWHGQYRRTVWKLNELLSIVRLPTTRRTPTGRRLVRLLCDLQRYLRTNARSLPDYGRRYRAGKRIATSFVESSVNQLVDKRMTKSQQMRWSHKGAHALLQVRAEVVDGRLSDAFARWYPGISRIHAQLEAA